MQSDCFRYFGMYTDKSDLISLREYHIMLKGYQERLLDSYELASVQALFYRNAQSDKVKRLDDIFKRPETLQTLAERERDRKEIAEKIRGNEAFFDSIETALKVGGDASG